ncbi:MAG: DUF5611 family protein [Methanobacteriota archaeon]|nr:MAG: DUF5611 family protein [Euryarchaeota archaeon]
MSEYEVRRGHQENISPEKLKAHMRDVFGNVEEKEERYVSSFGALRELRAWQGGKNILCVETDTDPGVDDEVALRTIKAYNTFLERATGYTAKERGKRAQKKAKEGK